MQVSELQQIILDKTGLKTSVKHCTGSMKGYVKIWPQFQNGSYPSFPFDLLPFFRGLLKEYDKGEPNPLFISISEIQIFGLEISDKIQYKKEAKPKPITEDTKVKQWGSKNSQMRLDKKAANYAKKRRGKNGDNMVKYW